MSEERYNFMQYKVDLHTHSILSHDGGLSEQDYRNILDAGILDCIAVTDHDETAFAVKLHGQLGEKIIVGEEISTRDGHIIGLFITQRIAHDQDATITVRQIHEQDGLVYIPHPFERLRKGVQDNVLRRIANEIDIMEVFNARSAIRGKPKQAEAFARQYGIVMASSSDAHSYAGVGSAYTVISDMPDRKTIQSLLANGEMYKHYVPPSAYLSPFFNTLKKMLHPITHNQ